MRFNLARTVAKSIGRPSPGGRFDLRRLCPTRRLANEEAIRALTANAYLGDDTALCRALGRYKLYVDTQDVGLSSHLLLDGYWEMWTTEVIARRARPGMVAADIGANLGYFTMLLADLVGPSGKVHAFEPNPALADRLRRSLSVNGFDRRTVVHSRPLSDRDHEQVRLAVARHDPMNGRIVAYESPGPGGHHDPMAMLTRRFDSLPALARVDFVKIDADAAEEAIWRGMAGLLQSDRSFTVIMEFLPERYRSPRGFLDEIQSQGFSLAMIDRTQGERPVTVDDVLAGSPHEDRMLLLCR